MVQQGCSLTSLEIGTIGWDYGLLEKRDETCWERRLRSSSRRTKFCGGESEPMAATFPQTILVCWWDWASSRAYHQGECAGRMARWKNGKTCRLINTPH